MIDCKNCPYEGYGPCPGCVHDTDTAKDMPELKPCPFCGGEAKIHTCMVKVGDRKIDEAPAAICIKCKKCDASSTRTGNWSLAMHVKAWNTRAARSRPQAPAEGEVAEAWEDEVMKRQKINIETSIAIEQGKWVHVHTIEEMSAFYMARLPFIREVAKEHGYAIGLHGSTRRDFDLMAMPWRENPSDKDVLARAIQKAACGFNHEKYQWEQKPCGREATSFPICWTEWHGMVSGGHVDLSIIQAATRSSQTGAEGLVKALEWYANPEKHTVKNVVFVTHEDGTGGQELRTAIETDKGSRARKAIAAHRKQTGEA